MYRLFFAGLCVLVLIPRAYAQRFDFPEAAAQDPTVLSKTVTRLAFWALPIYKEADQETYLTNLSALQAAASQYDEAVRSYGALRDFRRSARISNPEWRDLQYEIYVRAKAAAEAGGPLLRHDHNVIRFESLNERTGGAPLLALFKKWAATLLTPLWFWFWAAGRRIFIFSTSQSLTFTGPASPRAYGRKLLHFQSSGEVTNPRSTGLQCM